MWRHRRFLPLSADAEPVTLGEGDTPLLQARRLDPSGGLLLKNETVNPTGSFKDRPVAVAATVARELGLSGLVCASTGNTGVAVAAYAARAGLPAACVVPETTPAAKMIQIEAVGARVVRVRGNYSDAYALARAAAESHGWANLTSTYVNPYMLEGDKTVAYEVFEQLGERVPDWVLVPVGAGPLLAAIHKGFRELGVPGPRMVAVQATGCAPVVRAFDSGVKEVNEWEHAVENAPRSRTRCGVTPKTVLGRSPWCARVAARRSPSPRRRRAGPPSTLPDRRACSWSLAQPWRSPLTENSPPKR
jgi:threonine synthase